MPQENYVFQVNLGGMIDILSNHLYSSPDVFVREMNRDYRGLDKVTDVLSYEWHEEDFLGEIYIARDQVKRQAPEYGNTFYAELKRVIVHGLLHLSGYDHIKAADRKVMRKRECEFLGLDLYKEKA